MRRIGIFGAGGMARDALHTLDALGIGNRVGAFYEDDVIWRERDIHGIPVWPASRLDFAATDLVVAIGDGQARRDIVARMPSDASFPVFVHPSVLVGRKVELGAGTFICAGCILTTDITLGRHVQLNVGCTVTHDAKLGDFVTAGPGVRLSGNCTIGSGSYLGTGCVLRERTSIPPDTTIGMGAIVVRSVEESGIYLGNPARRVHR